MNKKSGGAKSSARRLSQGPGRGRGRGRGQSPRSGSGSRHRPGSGSGSGSGSRHRLGSGSGSGSRHGSGHRPKSGSRHRLTSGSRHGQMPGFVLGHKPASGLGLGFGIGLGRAPGPNDCRRTTHYINDALQVSSQFLARAVDHVQLAKWQVLQKYYQQSLLQPHKMQYYQQQAEQQQMWPPATGCGASMVGAPSCIYALPVSQTPSAQTSCTPRPGIRPCGSVDTPTQCKSKGGAQCGLPANCSILKPPCMSYPADICGRMNPPPLCPSHSVTQTCSVPTTCPQPPSSCPLSPPTCPLPPPPCPLPPPPCPLPPPTCPLPPPTCPLPPSACPLPPSACPLPPSACPLPPHSCPLLPPICPLPPPTCIHHSTCPVPPSYSSHCKRTSQHLACSLPSIHSQHSTCSQFPFVSSSESMFTTFPSTCMLPPGPCPVKGSSSCKIPDLMSSNESCSTLGMAGLDRGLLEAALKDEQQRFKTEKGQRHGHVQRQGHVQRHRKGTSGSSTPSNSSVRAPRRKSDRKSTMKGRRSEKSIGPWMQRSDFTSISTGGSYSGYNNPSPLTPKFPARTPPRPQTPGPPPTARGRRGGGPGGRSVNWPGRTPQAPLPVIPAQAPLPVIPAQAPSRVVPAQAPSRVIPAQAPSRVIPAQAPSRVIPTQAPSPVIPPQAPSSVIPTQPLSPGIPTQPLSPGIPAQRFSGTGPYLTTKQSGPGILVKTSSDMLSSFKIPRFILPTQNKSASRFKYRYPRSIHPTMAATTQSLNVDLSTPAPPIPSSCGRPSSEDMSAKCKNVRYSNISLHEVNQKSSTKVIDKQERRKTNVVGKKLLEATEVGDFGKVWNLLNASTDPNYACAQSGNTALHVACRKGHHDMLTLLLGHGANVLLRANGGKTALHVAAETDYSGRCVTKLLEANADMESKDLEGRTPLHYAAASGNSEALRVLIENGASLISKDKDGLTPADVANEDNLRRILKQ